jgi:hypothetical protein
MCAQSCLEALCDKLLSGEVNMEDLKKVDENQDQMQRLCRAVSSSEEGSSLYRSVEAAVKKRVEEYKAVEYRRQVLSDLHRRIHSVAKEVQGMLWHWTTI